MSARLTGEIEPSDLESRRVKVITLIPVPQPKSSARPGGCLWRKSISSVGKSQYPMEDLDSTIS